MELIFFVLDYGIKCVRDEEGPLIPSVTVEDEAGVRHLHLIVVDRLEQAIDQAMVFGDEVDIHSRVAVAYDGSVTVDGAQMDAIIVVARDRGRTEAQVVFAQRYKPKKPRQRFRAVGNLVFLCKPSRG
jgi:hypothetical protein